MTRPRIADRASAHRRGQGRGRIPSPSPSIVLFDLGGVLLRYQDEWCARRLARRSGVPYARIWNAVRRHRPALQAGRIGLPGFGGRIARSVRVPLPYDWRIIWTQELVRRGRPRRSVVRLVRGLRREGFRTGVLSNADHSHARVFRRRGWFRGLDPLLYSFELGAVKPEPTLYRRVERAVAVPGRSIVLVDDRPENVAAARRAGWSAVRFRGVRQLRRDLEALGIRPRGGSRPQRRNA